MTSIWREGNFGVKEAS